MGKNDQVVDFEQVKVRLEEIANAVSDETMPLDDALDLYEEAVSLGMRASDLLEVGILVEDEETASDPVDGAPAAAAPSSGEGVSESGVGAAQAAKGSQVSGE